MATSNKLSFLTDRVIPRHVREDRPNYVVLVKSYFEYLERELGEYDSVANLLLYRDLDDTIDPFIERFRLERAPNFPLLSAAHIRKLIKNVKAFYQTKGTEAGYKFLFKSIFDEVVTFTYPKDNVLRCSDATTLLDEDARIVDSVLWQDFSYIVKHASSGSSTFQQVMKDLTHPAGLRLFSEYSVATSVANMAMIVAASDTTLVILNAILNLGLVLDSSTLLQRTFKFLRTSATAHSTGWIVENKENIDIVKRSGFNTLKDWDTVNLADLEGRDGHALSMIFRNRAKDYMGNVSAIDQRLIINAVAPADVISVITLPKQRVNYADYYIDSTGTTGTIPINFVGIDKSKLFVFVAGKKLLPTEYTLPASNILTFLQTPNNGFAVEWYVVDHLTQTINYIFGTLNYSITIKNISASSKNLHVFVNGDYRIKDIDYRLDLVNNEVVFYNPENFGSKIEIVDFITPQVETFLIPEIEDIATVDAQLEYTLTNIPAGTETFTVTLDDIVQVRNFNYTYTPGTGLITLNVNPGVGASLKTYVVGKSDDAEDRTYLGYNTQTEFWMDEYIESYTPVRDSDTKYKTRTNTELNDAAGTTWSDHLSLIIETKLPSLTLDGWVL